MASPKRRRLSNRDLEFLENVMFAAAIQAVRFDMLLNRLRHYEDRQIAAEGKRDAYQIRNRAQAMMETLRNEAEDQTED